MLASRRGVSETIRPGRHLEMDTTWRNLFILLVLGCTGVLAAQDPAVTVQQGKLRGYKLYSLRGRTIFAFSGIPYAKPPLGDLRFREPEAPESWTNIRSAKQEGNPCIQRDIFFTKEPKLMGSEDCLYLNVYTPMLPKPGENVSSPLPVLFYIHGGGWMSGHGGKSQFGPEYLLEQETILVTINYRLGPLGFLSTGDAQCPGNNGLKDQVAALRWVQQNIAAFGGDPSKVTIFGQSAGGASVHYLLLSPLSRGLFQRAISLSGTAFAPWAKAREPAQKARRLATLLDCPETPSELMLSCLRSKDAAQFVDVVAKFAEWDIDPLIPFSPAVEPPHPGGRLVPAPVVALVREAERQLADTPVPWMAGLTAHDGSMRSSVIASKATLLEQLDRDFDKIAPLTLIFQDNVNIARKIRQFYFGDARINKLNIANLTDMYTDRQFLIPLLQSVATMRALDSERKVFLYQVSHRGRHSITSVLDPTSSTDYGVCHLDDLQYLFHMPDFFPRVPENVSDPDHAMMKVMTKLFVDFARTGNPTPDSEDKQQGGPGSTEEKFFEWTEATEDPLVFADLRPEPRMLESLHEHRADFWASLELRAEDGGTARAQPPAHTEL